MLCNISGPIAGFFVLSGYGSFFTEGIFTSHLSQEGIFLLGFGLCGAMIIIPFLVFVSLVIGWAVFTFRKTRTNSKEAKSQATAAGVSAFMFLILISCAIVAYWGRDLYIL